MGKLSQRFNWTELKGDWPAWLLIAAGFAVGVWALPHLPERMPAYWLLRVGARGYSGSFAAALFPPILHLVVYLALVVAPLVDPRRESPARVTRFYRGLRILAVALLSVTYAVYIYGGLLPAGGSP